jgi:hypothetical protein
MGQEFTSLTRNTVWDGSFTLWHTLRVMPSALEARIRELCANAVAAKDSEGLIPILAELRVALHEQDQIAKVLIAERTRMLNPKVNR